MQDEVGQGAGRPPDETRRIRRDAGGAGQAHGGEDVRRDSRRSGNAGAVSGDGPVLHRQVLRRRTGGGSCRQVDLPDGELPEAAGREDVAVPSPHLPRRLGQERARPVAVHRDRDVPARRHDRHADHPARTIPRPGDDLLARQQREPQGRDQRELRARASGTVLDGCWQLHGGRHQSRLPRLHRLDVPAAAVAVSQRPLPRRVRVPARRPRLRGQDLPGRDRPVRRRRRHRHHRQTARDGALHFSPSVQLLRRRRGAGAVLEYRAAARRGRHPTAFGRVLGDRRPDTPPCCANCSAPTSSRMPPRSRR